MRKIPSCHPEVEQEIEKSLAQLRFRFRKSLVHHVCGDYVWLELTVRPPVFFWHDSVIPRHLPRRISNLDFVKARRPNLMPEGLVPCVRMKWNTSIFVNRVGICRVHNVICSIAGPAIRYFVFAHCSVLFVSVLTQNIILNYLLEYSVTLL